MHDVRGEDQTGHGGVSLDSLARRLTAISPLRDGICASRPFSMSPSTPTSLAPPLPLPCCPRRLFPTQARSGAFQKLAKTAAENPMVGKLAASFRRVIR